MQLKLKNSIDVGIFDELTFATLTDDEITGEENLTIQSEVFNQEETSVDKVQEGNIDDKEEEEEELNLSAESKDDIENGNKRQRPGGQDDNRSRTKPKPNAKPIEHEGPGGCEQEDHQGADDFLHPCSSSGVSSQNTEVTIIIKSDFTKGGNETRHQGKESEMPRVGILSGQLEKTNTDTTLDKCTSSQQGNTRQMNPASAENTNEGKKRPVVWTLAVPSIQYSRISKRKDLPSPPECEETGQNDTLETDLTATNLETTEVRITVHPDDGQLDNNIDDDEDDDDGDISAEDLLCFSWQIAQGMVSNVRDKILQKKE